MTTIQTERRPALVAVLDRAREALLARRRADVDLLVAALEWAELHPATSSHDVAGRARPVRRGVPPPGR